MEWAALPSSRGSSWPRDWTLVSCSVGRFFTAEPPGKPCVMHAAAAKSLQSCPTLCDPIDGSPPGSPVPGILQARTLEWVAISFSNAWKWKVKMKSLSKCLILSDPMDCSPPGSSIHGIFQAKSTGVGAIAFSVCYAYFTTHKNNMTTIEASCLKLVLSILCILSSVLAMTLLVGIFSVLGLKVKEWSREKVTHPESHIYLVDDRAEIWGQADCVPI